MRGTHTMFGTGASLDAPLTVSLGPRLLAPVHSDSLGRIARLAASALSVPIVSVALFDEMRQWFGLDRPEYGGYGSLCEPNSVDGRTLAIPDATLDIRSAAHPLVTGSPHIRSFLSTSIRDGDGVVIGTLDAIALQPRQFTETDVGTAADFVNLIGELLRGREPQAEITELRDAYGRIRALAQRLESVYEDERRTLANVLHESVAQDLYAARLRLGFIESCSRSKSDALRGCHEAGVAIENCIEGMRQIADDLWPAGLAHHGVAAILQHHAGHCADLTGLSINVLEKTPFPVLDDAAQLIFFRAAQELLKNVVRHAQARNVTIALQADAAQIAMEVLDDGIGMVEGCATKLDSLGLLEIRERLAVLGGALDVERNLPRGTKVTVRIPNLQG